MARVKIKAAAQAHGADRRVLHHRPAQGDQGVPGSESSDPAGEPERFAISYDDMGPISTWTDTLLGGGPAGGRIEINAGELRLRMADFKVDVPRASVHQAYGPRIR